ncbi:SDR family NAD(P)-dependent oxidoreductase [Actinophytocola sp.]|uniref:SDR family NAD(P)-dependent oxidoreductase n=1 Tax=Actinophytocola sp. TaxID=1872138 RepID=UPI002ED49EC7
MEFGLTGKTAVITGASRGIGLEIARVLTAEGVRVAAGARRVTDELKEVTPHVLSVDLAEPAGPGEFIDFALAELGGIDILVNNLGFPHTRTGFLSVSDQDWLDGLTMNLLATVRTTRAALPSIVERRGSVVSLCSTNAHQPLPMVVDYSAAKAGLLNLGKALSEEFGPQGVRVNTVSCGPVMTDAWTGSGGIADVIAAQSGKTKEEIIDGAPELLGSSTGTHTTVDQVASLVTFLVSRKADNVNGAEFVIDGGFLKSI